MSEHKEPIPSMIYNASVGGHVTNSQQIIDENENKEQSQINAEVKETLGQGGSVDTRINQAKNDIIGGASSSGNTLKKIEDRVSPLEIAVGSGGSVDTRIDNAKSEIIGDAAPDYNTLGKLEDKIQAEVAARGTAITNLVGDAASDYNTLGKLEDKIQEEATGRATAVNAEALRAQAAEQLLQEQYNALNQSDIIVGTLPASGTKNKIYRVPGTNTYSDYMWNGTQFVKMAEYDNAIDDEPTAGSNNLVKSGGVAKSFGLWCYFTGDNVPSIEISDTTVSVVFSSSGALNIYSGSHTRIFQITCTGQSFTLNNLNRLVLNSNGTMEVVDNDSTGSYVVLVSNKYGRIGGLLADYYYNRVINDVRGQVNTYMWWSQGGDPVIVTNGDTVSVTFPAGKAWNIKRKDGVTIESNNNGNGQTFDVGSYKVLIFDRTDRTVKVVNTDSDALKNCFVFLMNVRGMYLSGLLEPFINYADRANADAAGYYIYWQSPGSNKFGIPKFNRDSVNHLTITFPNSNFHIYKKGGGYFVQSSNAGIETYEEGSQTLTRGKTFTLAANQVLVYDKSDNTIKTVGLGTALSSLCVILLTNILGVNGTGLLAPHYHYNCAQEEISIYYSGLGRPTFIVNGTTIRVTVPAGMIIESSTLGILESGTGTAGTYEIANRQKLVFDQTDRSMKVVSDSEYGVFYNLLTNNCGYVSGALSTYYLQYTNAIHNLYNTEKEKVILQNFVKRPYHEGSVIESSVVPLVLLHFSDLHEDRENLKRLLDYYSMHSSFITDILNTGDTINKFSDGYTWYEDIIKEKLGYTEVEEGGQTVQVPNNILLTTVGNHEMTNGSGEPTPTNKGVYDMQFKSAIDHNKWGDIVQPYNAEANGLCYYYKDYVTSRVRLIVLDNFASNMTAQATWLRSVLADANDLTINRTPEGEEATYFKYCVVCCAHFPTKINLMKNVTFCSMDGDGQFVFYMQDALVNEVDTFINNQGNFACWLTGHVHGNYFGFVTDHTNQICIAVASASYNRNSGSEARENGTKSQDCFNIVSINDDTKCITIHRVGSDYDKYLRHVGEMCFNFETKTLVYND